MKPDQAILLLQQALAELAQARDHLNYSHSQVLAFPQELENLTADQLESAEAFSSRFARTVDLLVNKVLRIVVEYSAPLIDFGGKR